MDSFKSWRKGTFNAWHFRNCTCWNSQILHAEHERGKEERTSCLSVRHTTNHFFIFYCTKWPRNRKMSFLFQHHVFVIRVSLKNTLEMRCIKYDKDIVLGKRIWTLFYSKIFWENPVEKVQHFYVLDKTTVLFCLNNLSHFYTAWWWKTSAAYCNSV